MFTDSKNMTSQEWTGWPTSNFVWESAELLARRRRPHVAMHCTCCFFWFTFWLFFTCCWSLHAAINSCI